MVLRRIHTVNTKGVYAQLLQVRNVARAAARISQWVGIVTGFGEGSSMA